MVNKIEAKISKIDVLERSYYGNKALHMRIEFEDGSVLETRGHDIGTYRDDNISKLEKLIKVGSVVDVIEGELGIAVNVNTKVKKYYSSDTYVLPDRTIVS